MQNGQIPYTNNKAVQTFPQSQQQPLQQQYQTPPAQNPNYAGVNIQIINPMVNPNGGYIYPQQTNSAFNPGTQGGCYPSTYYTTQPGTYSPYPQQGYPGTAGGYQSASGQNGQTGFYDQNGKYHPYVRGENGQIGYYDDNGKFQPLGAGNGQPQTGESGAQSGNIPAAETNKPEGTVETTTEKPGTAKETTETKPEVPPQQPEKDDSKEVPKENESSDGGKTEKKKVVMLSNDYIKTLENYLNSQDTEVRKMGAHEVVDRLSEDPSRKDDPALTALVNKMLQDPSTAIRTIALSLVESGTVSGDDYTVKLLKNMQQSKDGFGLDANQATSALLKMAGKTVEKEVPVTETKKNKETKAEKK